MNQPFSCPLPPPKFRTLPPPHSHLPVGGSTSTRPSLQSCPWGIESTGQRSGSIIKKSNHVLMLWVHGKVARNFLFSKSTCFFYIPKYANFLGPFSCGFTIYQFLPLGGLTSSFFSPPKLSVSKPSGEGGFNGRPDPSPPPSPREQARKWGADYLARGRRKQRIDYTTLIQQQTATHELMEKVYARYQELLQQCLDSVADHIDRHSSVGEYRDIGEYRCESAVLGNLISPRPRT